MKKSNKILSIIFSVVAILLVVIEVRFLSPVSQPRDEAASEIEQQITPEQNTPSNQATGQESNEISKPDGANSPESNNPPEENTTSIDSNQPNENEKKEPEKPKTIEDPNDPMEAVHINNMEMKNIISKLMEWTGKSIIPSNDAMKVKITVFTPDKLPRSKALQLIYGALKEQGYIVEQYDEDTLRIKQITDAVKLSMVPIIDSNTPLAAIENKEQIVQKFFKLKNYTPSQMGQVLLPMLGEYGNISSDDDTKILGIIDTVRTLMRMELVIKQFDTAAAEPMVEKIFEIRYRKPSDIIQLLQSLITDRNSAGSSLKNMSSGGSKNNSEPKQPVTPPPPAGANKSPRNATASNKSGGSATSITIGTGRTPPTYVVDPRDNLIIARATEPDMELISNWIAKLDTPATIIDEDTPLASIENKNLVAQRFFKLENYSPTMMVQLVRPVLSNTAYLSAEENTRTLLIVDTVANLIRAEEIIQTFDIPGTELAVPRIFDIQYGDPAEIVQVITMLLSQDGSGSRNSSGNISIRLTNGGYSISSGGRSASSGGFMPATSSSMMGGSTIPVVLIPNQERKQIIARAPAEAMQQIEEWIIRLDQKESIEKDYDIIAPNYIDVSEVSQRISQILSQTGQQGIQKNVFIQPLVKSGQIMIFGKKELRNLIKNIIMEVDIPPGILETKYFQLKHADPDIIKTRIDELYSKNYGSSSNSRSYTYDITYNYNYGDTFTSNIDKDSVRVISDPALRRITVIASAENMKKLEKQIEEWDVPLDPDSLKPRLKELRNVDPVKMAQFLTSLFTEESSGGMTYMQYYGYEDVEAQKKIVGPLYGQLTFEYIPGTKKIIIISKIPEAYDIIEKLIDEIDSEEMAEVPTVKSLKFANPERLCEILNATFSQPGASVEILRSDNGLSQFSMTEDNSQSNNNNGNSSDSSSRNGYTPWWGTSVSRNMSDDERPISNVIGRIRFVPENRTKSILILSPPEFTKNIEALIEALDRPSKQVMIKAVIVEVDHKNLSSLGVRLATDPAAFGTLGENSIAAFNTLQQLDTHGSSLFGASGAQGTLVTNTIDSEIYGLIDFLEKKVNAKILNQQTLWTQNNEEASFFKGDRVAFYTSASTSITAGNVQDTEFQRVGMNVAVRPSITPNKEVDMNINILISQLTSDEKNGQPVRTEMETKTKMVVSDGETLMLGGILFQQDEVIKRGVPGLSEIPILGGLFTHNEKTLVNNELIVFITPFVYDTDEESGGVSPEILEQINIPLDKLNMIREQLNRDINDMDLVK